MGKHYTEEFNIKVLDEYKSGKYGGSDSVSKRNKISKSTLWKWIIKDRKYGFVINDIENNRGRSKEESIDYKDTTREKVTFINLYINKYKLSNMCAH